MFNDPYGANLLDDDDDSETEDDEPTITQGSKVERLEIENVVNLASKKLLARYNNALEPKTAAQPAKTTRKETALPSNGQRRTGQQRLLTSNHGRLYYQPFLHNLSSCISCSTSFSCTVSWHTTYIFA
jgi:hypothetical protein